jgi:hypothetical protein
MRRSQGMAGRVPPPRLECSPVAGPSDRPAPGLPDGRSRRGICSTSASCRAARRGRKTGDRGFVSWTGGPPRGIGPDEPPWRSALRRWYLQATATDVRPLRRRALSHSPAAWAAESVGCAFHARRQAHGPGHRRGCSSRRGAMAVGGCGLAASAASRRSSSGICVSLMCRRASSGPK